MFRLNMFLLILLLTIDFQFIGQERLKDSLKKEVQQLTKSSFVSKSTEITGFLENDTLLSEYDKGAIYTLFADQSYYLEKETSLIYHYLLQAMLKGVNHSSAIETPAAQFLRKENNKRDLTLKNKSDSLVLENNKNLEVDTDLLFEVREMERLDQRIRYKINEAERTNKNALLLDSLSKQLAQIDASNEQKLKAIFDKYGKYPGFSLVGKEQSAAFLVFHHTSTDFRVAYMSLVSAVVENKDLFVDLSFVIDKTFYEKHGVTLFGTHYTGQPKVEDEEVIKKYLGYLDLNPK